MDWTEFMRLDIKIKIETDQRSAKPWRNLMTFKRLAVAAIIAVGFVGPAIGQGFISKIAEKTPQSDYLSKAHIFDIERCLLDMRGAFIPTVYSQPDRPNQRMLLWIGSGAMFTSNVAARVDLQRETGGTRVKMWNVTTIKQAKDCAPA